MAGQLSKVEGWEGAASSCGSRLRALGTGVSVSARECEYVLCAPGQCVASSALAADLAGALPGAREGKGEGWWRRLVRVAVRVAVSVSAWRARAAENQEVTAAKRTQTCLIAVT